MARVSVKVPVLPPEKVIVVRINWKEPACQDEEAAGVKLRTGGEPIVPVSPVKVMVKVAPTVGVDGLTTTEATLLALALMVLCTDVNEKSWLVSKLPEAGGPLNTLTVWVCVTSVSALDPR